MCFLLVPITQYLVCFGRIGVERIKCYDSSVLALVIGSHVVKSVYITSYFTDTFGVLGYSLFSYARTLLSIVHSNYVGMKEGNFQIYRPSEKIQNLIFNNVLKRINSYMVLFLHVVRFDLSNCVEGGYVSILSVLVFFCCSTVSVHISVTLLQL